MNVEVSPVIAYAIILGAVCAIIGTFVFGFPIPTIVGAIIGLLIGFVLGDMTKRRDK